MPTQHVIIFDSDNESLVTVKTEPEQLYVNQDFLIKLYSATDFDLESPYNGLGAKKNSASPTQTQTIELNGSPDLTTDYPIKSLTSVITDIAIVNEDTRKVILTEKESALPCFDVINQALKVKNGLKLHGSVTVTYQTFDAQIWQHSAFRKKGNVLLFRRNTETNDYKNVPLSISDNAESSNIRIEPWALPDRWGINNPYHAFVIYPANKRYDVVPSIGRVEYKQLVENHIKNEEITFNGKECSTSYKIKRLIKFTGIFWDMNRRRVHPNFRLDNGVIKSDVECYGFASAEYTTDGLMYYYYADVNQGGNGSVAIEAGVLVVQDIDKKGVGATYTLPSTDFIMPVDETEFCKIYKKVITQDDGRVFKVPPSWSSGDNTYPNYNGQDLPDPDKGFETGSSVVTCKITSDGVIKVTTHNNIETLPFELPEQYDIAENMPSNIDDSALLSKMQSKINELKTQYGIA